MIVVISSDVYVMPHLSIHRQDRHFSYSWTYLHELNKLFFDVLFPFDRLFITWSQKSLKYKSHREKESTFFISFFKYWSRPDSRLTKFWRNQIALCFYRILFIRTRKNDHRNYFKHFSILSKLKDIFLSISSISTNSVEGYSWIKEMILEIQSGFQVILIQIEL